jgi:co-chaperonin GroES (HSP10)
MSDRGATPIRRPAGAASTSQVPAVRFGQTLDEAFPKVDPGHAPFHNLLLVQYPTPKTRTESGIMLPEDTRATIQWNTQTVKVIAIGPVAFCNRDTLEPWPEGAWCKVGEFIRVGKYATDKWEVPLSSNRDDGVALFGLVEDKDLRAKVIADPLSIIAFV